MLNQQRVKKELPIVQLYWSIASYTYIVIIASLEALKMYCVLRASVPSLPL